MRKLAVDTAELAAAMEDHSYEFDWYLDTETGKVLMLPGDAALDPGAWPEEEIERYERLMEEDPERFQPTPQIPSHQGYDWMSSFTETVEDELIRQVLRVALDGQGAFGRFRRTLTGYPEERERWFRYHHERIEAEMRLWLESLGIEPEESKGS